MAAEKETVRVTLGVGLILAVLSIAPETARFYLSARSADREADLKASALFSGWSSQQAAWGVQIRQLANLRGEKRMKELDESLPQLPPQLDAFANAAAKQLNLDVKTLKFNMRIAEQFNRPVDITPTKAVDVEDLNKQIEKLEANPIVDRGFLMSIAQSADEAIAFAKAKQADLVEAYWFISISGLFHIVSFVAGCCLIISGVRAPRTQST